MNFALSSEQEMMREAARGRLTDVRTFQAARATLDGGDPLDLWPSARDAGWPGLLVSEDARGAGLSLFEALLVVEECGRALAGIPLIGHWLATTLLASTGNETLEPLAEGHARGAVITARPPDDLLSRWTLDPRVGPEREPAIRAHGDGADVVLDGRASWVLDAYAADVIVCVAVDERGEPLAVAVRAGSVGLRVDPVRRYDPTRSLAHINLQDAVGQVLDVAPRAVETVWYAAQALIAAESLGAAQRALELSVEYAQRRHTFGRPIGSYQAVKHRLTEVLRLNENTRSLLYYAGWAHDHSPDEFALAASAARNAGGRALDFAARSMVAVHGGVGVTWEHDAHLFFRRSQLSRLLLGGTADASDRVTGELLRQVA